MTLDDGSQVDVESSTAASTSSAPVPTTTAPATTTPTAGDVNRRRRRSGPHCGHPGRRPGGWLICRCESALTDLRPTAVHRPSVRRPPPLPRGFLWCAGTSAYQIEGGIHLDDRRRRSGTRSAAGHARGDLGRRRRPPAPDGPRRGPHRPAGLAVSVLRSPGPGYNPPRGRRRAGSGSTSIGRWSTSS